MGNWIHHRPDHGYFRVPIMVTSRSVPFSESFLDALAKNEGNILKDLTLFSELLEN